MINRGHIFDMTPLGMKFTVLKTNKDTEGKSLDLYWELLPDCNKKDPLVHIHPNAIETYEVLDGEMEFYIKDSWVPAKKGEKFIVPIGVPHTFRNLSDHIVTVYNTHEPALKMEEYFDDVCKILDILTENRTKSFKMNLKAKLYIGLLMNNYRDEIIATKPPDAVIKILGAIARLARLNYRYT